MVPVHNCYISKLIEMKALEFCRHDYSTRVSADNIYFTSEALYCIGHNALNGLKRHSSPPLYPFCSKCLTSAAQGHCIDVHAEIERNSEWFGIQDQLNS